MFTEMVSLQLLTDSLKSRPDFSIVYSRTDGPEPNSLFSSFDLSCKQATQVKMPRCRTVTLGLVHVSILFNVFIFRDVSLQSYVPRNQNLCLCRDPFLVNMN
jgi:hypothetical protein